MIFGIGTDVLQAQRVEKTWQRFGEHFARRLLLDEELALFAKAKRPVRFLAMRFAAKEAIVKALGTGFANGVWVRDVGMMPNRLGQPQVVYSERGRAVCRKLGVGEGHLTLSDEAGLDRRGGRVDAREPCTGENHEHAGIRHRDRARRRARPAAVRPRRPRRRGRGAGDVREAAALAAERFPAAAAAARRRDLRRCCAAATGLRIFSLGDEQSSERELVQRFFDGLERYSPVLVSWNGSGFDLPVLNYRALRHGVNAHRYWEVGESDRDFRYNNYLSRYHWRHIDLMDVLSGYGASGRASLELASQLIGLPGKLGIGGAQVWPAYRRGELAAIRDYCETDVLNTYLIYLRFRAHARRARRRGVSERARRRRSEARAVGSAALEAVPRRSGRRRGMRADGAAVVATIVDLTHDGMGVADLDGRRVFVADALPGERVEIVLRKRRRKLQEADLVRVLEPSPARVVPGCEYFGRCGGCALQHLDASMRRSRSSSASSRRR